MSPTADRPAADGVCRCPEPDDTARCRGCAAAARRRQATGRARDWAELLRISAAFSVPGDAIAGAAAAGGRLGARTALAAASSLCLYEAGMALNDYADRRIDAVERPHRPVPSGRISPGAALGAGAALTAAGLACAAAAGRPALATAGALAGAVWAYDLGLKNTPAGPFAMAGARALDLLLGAAASRPAGMAAAVPSALLLGAHTLAVTTVSRQEAEGGSPVAPLAALAGSAAIGCALQRAHPVPPAPGPFTPPAPLVAAATALTAAGYTAACARPYTHAALNPSPALLQRAVGGGIRATIPLQAALTARTGALAAALPLLGLLPLARRLSRKVSPT